MVECEYVYTRFVNRSSGVLIDTWWNVNILTPQSFGEEQLSFNRYMVECESYPLSSLSARIPSFNRYMVECECRHMAFLSNNSNVLIDTWWNVNEVVQAHDEGIIQF